MDIAKKPRADAVLKTLTKDRQSDIAEFARSHTLAETVKWLGADGVRIQKSALSRWLSWWQWQQIYVQSESDAEDFKEMVRKEYPDMDIEKVERFGHLFFQRAAIKRDQPQIFLKFSSARSKAALEKAKLAQTDRRIKLLEEKAAKADQAAEVTKSALTPEEKDRRMKEILGLS